MDQLTSRVEVRDFNGGEAGDYYDLQGDEPETLKLHDITLYDVCMSQQQSVRHEYVSLQLLVQNRTRKWHFPLNFRTLHKLQIYI